MQLTPQLLNQLETPCLVIDVETAKKNILAMQQSANQYGCALRPHIKTHKMAYFAKLQMEAGAKGITCAKVSEAEIMANAGIRDIFIAYPLVGQFRIRRALALLSQTDRLILAVDSFACASALSEQAQATGVCFEVRIEVDTGAKRTGVLRKDAAELAKQVASLPGLRLTGIYTFKSLIYQDQPTQDNALAAQEEGELLQSTAGAIRQAGIEITDISGGSSPTGELVAATGMVNEIRPGTYIFKDLLLYEEKVATLNEIAVRQVATVVSTPSKKFAVLDGGTKFFPTDIPLNTAPMNFSGYAVVEGRSDLLLTRMNEEHGILTATGNETSLTVGQKLTLLPLHVCTAVNLQNQVYLLENGTLRAQKVDARGMLV